MRRIMLVILAFMVVGCAGNTVKDAVQEKICPPVKVCPKAPPCPQIVDNEEAADRLEVALYEAIEGKESCERAFQRSLRKVR